MERSKWELSFMLFNKITLENKKMGKKQIKHQKYFFNIINEKEIIP